MSQESQFNKFYEDMMSKMYLQISILTYQVEALTKILLSKTLLDEEEIVAMNVDIKDMLNKIQDLTGVQENDMERVNGDSAKT